MPEFDLSSRTCPFRAVITTHNTALARLRAWRTQFAALAGPLTDFIMDYPKSAATRAYWGGMRGEIERVFQHGAGRQGNRSAFDPWGGWWNGSWTNPTSRLAQFHIWDATQGYGGRHIQPVTQSVTRYAHRNNYAAAWTATPAKVDLGINVWSGADGITGWVSKRQYGREELPHVGYLLNPHTLVWITQVNWTGDYYMFFEWVWPRRRQYGIHGRPFTINGTTIMRKPPTGWTTYNRGTVNRR